MDPYANAGCVLKMNVKCEACITKLTDALGSICGVYTINIDAERGTVDISGQVDPNSLLLTLLRSGEHAELVRVKLQHPAVGLRSSYHDSNNVNSNTYNNYGHLTWSGGSNNYNNGNSYGYGINDPYLYDHRRSLLGNYDELSYYSPSPNDYYSWHNRNYAYDPPPLPPARYAPSGPTAADCDPYDDEPVGFCSIM